jgi:hypothetical protein
VVDFFAFWNLDVTVEGVVMVEREGERERERGCEVFK